MDKWIQSGFIWPSLFDFSPHHHKTRANCLAQVDWLAISFVGLKVRGAYDRFADVFVWAHLLIVHTWNSSPLRSNLNLRSNLHSWWISKMQPGREDTLEERYAINSVLNLVKIPHKNVWDASDCFWSILYESVFEWHKRFKEGRESVRDDERCGRSKKVNTPELIAQWVRVRVTMLRFQGSSERDSAGRGQHSSNRVSGISTRTMHQFTNPSLSQTISPRWASRQFLSLPIVKTLLPVTFAYSLSSEAVVMRQLRRWKWLWRRSLRRSHVRTSMGPSRSCWNGTTSALQPEEITSKGTRVSCVYYQ